MADLTISGLQPTVRVDAGASHSFGVSVSGGTAPYTFTWKKDDKAIQDATTDTYSIASVETTHAGSYTVEVKDQQGTAASATSKLEVAPKKEDDVALLWRPQVAIWGFVVAVLAFLLLLGPLWATIKTVLPNDNETALFAGVVAAELVIVGTATIVVGLYLAFLEFNARARTMAELRGEEERPEAEGGPTPLGIPVGDILKAAPELVTRFGSLKASAAALVVGVVLFICATTLAWKAVPDTATQDTTVTDSTSSTPTDTTSTDTTPTDTAPTETTPTTPTG